MGDAAFPGRVHFVAHAVRDMADRLVDVLDPQTKGSRVQYENEMDVIVKDWPTMEPMDGSEAGPGVEESLAIPIQVARRIDRLVRAHRDRRKRPTQYELLFRFLMRNEPLHARLNERLVRDFQNTRKWFMDLTHLRSGKPPQVDEGEFLSYFNKFEAMLHSFVGKFFTGTRELDAILHKANERRR